MLCTKRCHRKNWERSVNASQKDAVDRTATTGESAVDEETSSWVEMAHLDSE